MSQRVVALPRTLAELAQHLLPLERHLETAAGVIANA